MIDLMIRLIGCLGDQSTVVSLGCTNNYLSYGLGIIKIDPVVPKIHI
jgi:hypothetical protein